MNRVGLLQACDDPQLLNFALWPRQRELLGDLDRGPRLQVWCVGRRSGKTTLAALGALHSCLLRPDLDRLVRPGETRFAVAVATNQSQARILVSAARSIVEASPLLSPLLTHSNEDALHFTLPSGARTALRALPANSRGARGLPISFLVLDEAAHMLDADSNDGYQAARLIYEALDPATLQFGDAARVVISSTPYGSEGFFADMHARAASGELGGAQAAHATTQEMNPTVTLAWLAAAQARDPEAYRSELLAEFVGSGGSFLDFDRFEFSRRGELPPHALAAGSAVAGLDPAFGGRDAFGLAIVGRAPDDPRRLVCALHRAWTPRRVDDSFEARRRVEDELLALVASECQRFGATATTDQYLATSVVDKLSRLGIPVDVHAMGATTKTAIFTELRSQLYEGMDLAEDPELLAELRRLRSKFSAGSATVITPRVGNNHCDQAQALAMATWASVQRGQPGGTVRAPRYPTTFGNLQKRAL